MKAFLCHSSNDSAFVIDVAKHLKRNLEDVFYYEHYQRSDESFLRAINQALDDCQVMLIFVGAELSEYQIDEANTALHISMEGRRRDFFIILLPGREEIPAELNMLRTRQRLIAKSKEEDEVFRISKEIVTTLQRPWLSADDLPYNPHLFSYEKDIIEYFIDKVRLGDDLFAKEPSSQQQHKYEQLRRKWLEGCPAKWPEVVHWNEQQIQNKLDQNDVGKFRSTDARVVVAALTNYHKSRDEDGAILESCMIREGLCFPEAGPRESLYFPSTPRGLRVAVLVSGGIAPGINAVIDGIAQRHYAYASVHGYEAQVYGFKNGFRAFDNLDQSYCMLATREHQFPARPELVTSDHANEGGSMLGTSRVEELIDIGSRQTGLEHIVAQLFAWGIDILYIIGGDGSMKAAHAIWSVAQALSKARDLARRLSVVAIPKTMDNDILWMWQSFGFLSAVEKAREVIDHLATEVKSNPRLCVVQLFGSDSGFVVSHAVLASRTGHCDVALIPEVEFSMRGLAKYLKMKMCMRQERIPYGLVVMAETAIPTDAMHYVNEKGEIYKIGLNDEEKNAIEEFEEIRKKGKRIQGQTSDLLRNAGLKIVSRGLHKLLPSNEIQMGIPFAPDWHQLRVFTNEPRHLLRAIPPSCSDIIIGNRLGTLAVDNALAGYTDFMISQWLTEYVLVPLKLVVLGRKRIPDPGIFWKSVLAKTGQPAKLV
jgi:6-phosphofructokinase 1